MEDGYFLFELKNQKKKERQEGRWFLFFILSISILTPPKSYSTMIFEKE
jgi:hypothetical protein